MAQFKEIDDYNFPFEIGVLPRRELALKFADYLNSIGIKATAKPGFGANYSIYVANESDVSKAKLELLRFGNNPFAKAYNEASWARGRTLKRERAVKSGGMWSFSLGGGHVWSLMSLTSFLEILCLVVFVLMLVPAGEALMLELLSWHSASEITSGFQVWRLLTPIFLHFGILHIAFNLVMFEAFARPLERHLGTMHLLYVVLSIALVCGGSRSPDPFYFLRYALDPDGDGRFGVRFEELSPAELGSADLRRFGLVIVAGTVPENRCNEFVKNGGRLWRLPVPGGKQLPAAGKKAKFSGALAPLNDLLELDFIAWKQIAPLPVPEGAETWLSFSDGTALLTRRRLGDGIRFDSAFDLRNRASNWPLLRSFPVAMAKLVEAMAPDDASSVTRSEPAGAESEPAVASGAELRRTLPGVRELRLDGDWRLRLEELRRGTELAGWLLLTALLLFGVDCWMCRKEAA